MGSERPEYNCEATRPGAAKGLLSRYGRQTVIVKRQEQPAQVPSSQWRDALASTLYIVRNWSDHVASGYGYTREPAPPPLEVYHPSAAPQTARWKRSHIMRLVMMRRRRVRRDSLTARHAGMGVLLAALLLLVVLLSSGCAYTYGYYQRQIPKLEQIANQHISQTTRIYDRNNTLLYEWYDPNPVSGGKRTPIRFSDVPQVLRDAMVATEDKTFWSNTGVDPLAIVRASSVGSSGASTITQQLIKNLTGNDQRSYERKLNEAALAVGLTQQYPKWKILEMYFNVAPFDSSDRGIEAAAEKFFNVKVHCNANFSCPPGITRLSYDEQTRRDKPVLGLARAAILAGMPQSPYLYDPANGAEFRERMLARQQYVLDQMVAQNYTTVAMAQQAHELTQKMIFKQSRRVKRAPHFVDWIRDQMAITLGDGDYNAGLQAFLTGGFNVRTSIDGNLQAYVENAVKRHLTESDFQIFPAPAHYAVLNRDNNVNNAAVVVMNAHTGEVLAMDGSVDYNNTTDARVAGNVNVATSPRSPGSTFKPIVYATAFEMGWYPGIVLPDFKTYFPNGQPAGTIADKTHTYVPPDYGGEDFHWNIDATIRQATAMSLNVPAVKALSFTGLDNVLANARLMGITTLDDELNSPKCAGRSALTCLGISTVLGTHGVSLLQMVGAYQTFADDGEHVPSQSILDVWDNYGHNLYHFNPAQVQGTRVFSKQVSYMMTSVLADEHARQQEFLGDHDLSFWDWDATCRVARAPRPDCLNHQVAAKTGTTDELMDNWAIGYTPNVVVGVWAGNANGNSMVDVAGISGAAPIWHSVMEFASGRACTDIDPRIACPEGFNRSGLNLNQPDTFNEPEGLQQVCTSSIDGLLGSGHCDWMLEGQQPQQIGVKTGFFNDQNGVQSGGDQTNSSGNTDNSMNGPDNSGNLDSGSDPNNLDNSGNSNSPISGGGHANHKHHSSSGGG